MVRKLVLSFIAVMGAIVLAGAQTRQVSGTVTGADGSPIVGASVLVAGTSNGTATDVAGDFTLTAPANGTLTVSFIGYQTKSVAIAGKTRLAITLDEDTHGIDDVVITSFGTVKKKDLTGSVSSVSAQDIAKTTVSSATKMLEGAVAGVQSISTSGQPGQDADIYIRGIGSINGLKSALIVLDGVPYSSALSTINPLDIESIVVSKDAAANALYGSRAANGIVFVTTKKGSRNQKAKIMFEGKWGWNEMGVGEHETMQNAGDYYEYIYGGLYNYGMDASGGDTNVATNIAQGNLMTFCGNYMAYKIPEGTTLIDPATGKLNSEAKLLYYDNYDDYLFKKQFRQEYTLSVSGGSDKMDYYVSGNFLEDPSYVIMSKFKRYAGRASFNAQATKWLKVGTNISYSRRETDDPGFGDGANTGNAFMWSFWQIPIVPYYARDLEGNIRYNEDGTKMLEQGGGQTLSPYGPTEDMFNAFNNYANPEQSFSRDINKKIRDNVYANFYADVTFLKHFKFTANFTLDNVYNTNTYYQNNEYGYGTNPTVNGFVEKVVNNYSSYNTQQILNYTNSICGKHNVDVLIGHEFNKSKQEVIDAYKKNVYYPGIGELGNAVSVYGDGSTSQTITEAVEGYFVRANYNYDGRYFFMGSYRYDGSSKFKYDKWGSFWSIGGAWQIKAERFMSDVNWIDNLKLRVNYGVSGNQIADTYPYTNLWDITESNGKIGVSQATVGNRNLSWEKNKQIDVGLDFSFLGRIHGSIDYYNRRTHDLIWNRPTPASTGLTSSLQNVGILGNRGFEIELDFDVIKSKSVYWNIGVNAAFQRNRLIDFPEELGNPALGGDYVSGKFLRGKGKSYYNLYLFKFAGVDPETGNETFWADETDDEGNVIGRKKVFDMNEATQYECGDALPDMTGGLRTTFRWKGLDISLAAAFQIGGKQWDGNSANLYDPFRAMFAVSQDLVGNTWTPENPNAKFPKLMYNGAWNFVSSSCDALYRDASYFSLKTVNVGYTLPKRWTSKIGLESVRVFFAADNVYFTSAHSGFDPRTGFTGQNGFGFPQARTFTFGVTLNL